MTEDTKRPVRRFRAKNLLVLPQGLITAPGANNMRLDPDHIVELDADAVQRHERFINGRVRAGDLEEVEEHVVMEPATPSSRRDAKAKADKEGSDR